MTALRRNIILFCALVVMLPSVASAADVHPDANPFNPAFAAYLGSGIYVVSGRAAYILRAPVGVRLRSEDDHPFGIRLRINAALGFYDLNPNDLGSFLDVDSIGTITLVPGIEFPIKLYERWTFGPFFDIGASYNNAINETTGVMGVGMRSRADLGKGRLGYLLWNDLIYGNNLNTDTVFDDFLLFRTRFDLRQLVNFNVFNHANDFGLLFWNEVYLDEVRFAEPREETPITRVRWEFGFTVGPSEKVKFLKKLIPAPRIGVSYRFGDGPGAVRFILTSRY